MAVQLDPRLYSGGNERFDSSPSVNFYAQLMAKEQAKKEAFDEYIRNLNKGVNPAGMRNQEREIFDEKLAAWQKYGMENRDAIRKRAGGADIKFMNDYQDILNIIAESKTSEEKKKPFVELWLDPNKRERVNTDQVMQNLHTQDQPLYKKNADGQWERNPDFKPIDITSVAFNPKPFEQDKYFKQFEDVKRMELPPSVVNDPKTMMQTITTTSVFDPEAKEVIAQRAMTDYTQNPSFREVVKGLNKEDYNPVFKANYGRDIENEADLAAAYTLKGLQSTVKTAKATPDTFARQREMAAIQDQYARRRLALGQQYKKDLIAFRGAGNKQDQDQVLEAWIERTFKEGKGTYNPVMIKGKFIPGRQIAVPIDIKKKYTIVTGKDDDGKDVKEMPRFVMTEDKKFVVPLYPGKKSDWTEPIPIETFRNELGKLWLSAKDRVGEMDEVSWDNDEEVEDVTTTIVQEPVDDGYTVDELKSAGWTDKQISEAKTSGKIKIK